MNKALFIDRDGTILVEPADEQIDALSKFSFVPGAIVALARIARELDYQLVMVTNQDGLGTASFPEATFWPVHDAMLRVLESAGVRFADVHIDRTLPADGVTTRKPGTGMLTRYLGGNYDLARSFVIGDRDTDTALAHNLGCGAIRIGVERDPDASLTTTEWDEIYRYLRSLPRTAVVSRETAETRVFVGINLDGTGSAWTGTGLGFLDHMLDQVARHAGIDLEVRTEGDLHVDEHHTVEDTALTLGAALREALGSGFGIERFAFRAPMDEARADVTLDLSGRAFLDWRVSFRREYIGDVPTELFAHFFRSLCDSAGCTLHIAVRGKNEHHMIESVFKAFARCLRDAVARTGSGMPSTKGSL